MTVFTIIAALLALGVGRRASNLNRINYRIGGLRWGGVQGGDILTDLLIIISNPSRDTITVNQTAAQILKDGAVIGFANQNSPVNIEAYKEVTLRIRSRLSLAAVLRIAPAIIRTRQLDGLTIVGNMVVGGVEVPIDQPLTLTA